MIDTKKLFEMYDSYQTKKNLKIGVTQFLQSVYPKTNKDNLEEFNRKYFTEKRNIEEDIVNFLKTLKEYAPLSKKLKISIAKTYLQENDVELPQKFWKKINRKIKGSRALTLDRLPTKKEFNKLLMHMPIQGKALFLVLESSGMRIGETINTTLNDLKLEETPALIEIRGENTKTGNSRRAFISSEAKEALIEWKKVREQYLDSAVRKSSLHPKNEDDNRVFPFDVRTAYAIWKNALHKAGLNDKDKSTNREKIHPHVLRKNFRTRLATVIPVDVVEALMGHEGYLTEVYRRYSLEDLKKFYLKGEPSLLVFTDTQKVVDLHKQIEEKNTQLQVLVNSLASENQNMRLENQKIKKEFEALRTEFKTMRHLITELVNEKQNRS